MSEICCSTGECGCGQNEFKFEEKLHEIKAFIDPNDNRCLMSNGKCIRSDHFICKGKKDE